MKDTDASQDESLESLRARIAELEAIVAARDDESDGVSRLEQISTLDEISRTILAAQDMREAMNAVLDLMLELFDCDIVSLVRAVQPGQKVVIADYESHRPGFPGTLAKGVELPVGPELHATVAGILASNGALSSYAGELPLPEDVERLFGVHSALVVAVRPLFGDPWLLILNHCRSTREWTRRDRRLLETIAKRFVDILTLLISDEHRRATEARYRTLVENAPEALVVFDVAEGHIVDANQQACEMFKLERHELLRATPGTLSPPTQLDGSDSHEAASERVRRALEEGPQVFEWMHVDSEGSAIPCEVRLVRLPGESPQIRGSMIDIRERKRLEGELRQSQKMEAVGSLAGGIAHDFNNLLVAILGNAEYAVELLPEESELLDPLREIQRAGERAASLTSQLLAFSRKQVNEPAILDLNQCVRSVSRLIERLIGEHITLVTELDETAPCIRADAVQVEQVILNLCTNARDAMPHGGTLVIRTTIVEPDHVLLCVIDDGAGMTSDLIARAPEPFFTTKEVGKGTGLGLSTVYGIVTQAGGEFSIESTPGEGSKICAKFPRVAPPPVEPPAPPHSEHAPTRAGAERILCVEDDASVAFVVERTLRSHGYSVIVARDGQEALELARGGLEFDVLLTDVIMPRMGGPELARRLRETHPGLKVLYCTGHSPENLPRESGYDVVHKPFQSHELLERLRGVLAS
ncbi:MAG: response regulator [Planctomycetes bacterium]|nr:response regulator [Planctomycetota bacterium]MCB9905418.1 response regulator [Planctomycetota bacterium]